jgi:hypothetical protein
MLKPQYKTKDSASQAKSLVRFASADANKRRVLLRNLGSSGEDRARECILHDYDTDQTAKVTELGEVEFRRQKRAFEAILPAQLSQYSGQFVISKDGQILDHDLDLVSLTNRFFGQHRDAQVYITRVGGMPEIRIDTPFFD